MYTLPKASSCPDTHWLSTLTDAGNNGAVGQFDGATSVRVSLPAIGPFRVEGSGSLLCILLVHRTFCGLSFLF